MNYLDGKELAKREEKNLSEVIKAKYITPKLVIISCGDDPASAVYMRNKKKAAARIGIECEEINFNREITNNDLLNKIRELNNDDSVSGIIVQLPIPRHLNVNLIQDEIAPEKDVDGFSLKSKFEPCTPLGCLRLIDDKHLSVAGKHCVVIGRSEIVGKPLAKMLLARNATVTQCHSKTPTELLKKMCLNADFIFSAAGKVNLIQPDFIKEGCVLVDISINYNEDGKLCGDAAPECAEKCSYISPVPGGVGPMTVNTLMKNTVAAAIIQKMKNN